MKKMILLIGPTLMIFIGLTIYGSVPLTFGLFYSWLLIVPVYFSLTNQNHSKWKVSITRNSVLLGAASGIAFLLIIFAGISFLFSSLMELELIRLLLEEWNFNGSMVWGLIAVLLILNPYLEENYWRNFIFEELKVSMSPANAIFISSFFYSLYHLLSLVELFNWPFNILAVIPVFIAGLIWGLFRHKSSSLAAPVISHILADVGIMMVYLVHIHSW
ncbi:lysostaphin resistance A-like protein [Bacillus sp. SCS-153A]|uniref:CPBP family intramembrane glutamic endopeptidase n=1 Tax=Rossellomorea sedimentorum TaxID=3115294 RepID=UPI003905E633